MATAEVGALRVTLGMNAGEFERNARRAEKSIKSIGGAFEEISRQMNAASVFINTGIQAAREFASAASGIINTAAAFEKGMANVATLVDTNVESIKDMSAAVLEIGKRTPVALSDLTQGLYDLRSAGVGADDQMRLLEGSARLGVAALGSTAETVDIVTSAINAFGLQGAEADRVFDLLFKTTNYGKTTISGLARGFGAVAGTVANAGVKLDEYLAAVSALTTTGLPAAEAHTQIRAAIAGLTRESEIGTKVLKTLGAKTFKELVQESGGLVQAFEKIRATLQSNDANIIKLLGSVEAYNAVLGLTGKQNESFARTLVEMREGAAQLDGAFQKQVDTLDGHMKLLRNNIEAFGTSVGAALAPTVKEMSQVVSDLTTAFRSLSPETQEQIAQIAAYTAIIGPSIIAVGFLTNALANLIPVFKDLGVAITLLTTGPIGGFIAAAGVATMAWIVFRDDYERIWRDIDFISTSGVAKVLTSLRAMHLIIAELSGGKNPMQNVPTPPASSGFAAYNREIQDVKENLTSLVGPFQTTTEALREGIPITNLATAEKQKMNDTLREYNRLVAEGINLAKQARDPLQVQADQMRALEAAVSAGKISTEQFAAAQSRAAYITQNAYASMASGIIGSLEQAFGQNKAVAIASAIINTYEAFTKALAAYPPPFNYAAAAATLAAGFAQVANIRKTTKSSGGGGGSSAAPAGTGGGAGSVPQLLTVQGLSGDTLLRGADVGMLAERLLQFQRDGGQVVIDR